MITALIPACNEGASLPDSVASVRGQVDRVIVIVNNCTDDTLDVANSLDVDVLNLGTSPGRKAGALNRGLELVDEGLVLAMDADTRLSSNWVEEALKSLDEPQVGGVGAVFGAAAPTSYLELCQFMEWERYKEEGERTGKTFVMSGTAALIKYDALKTVHDKFGRFYDEDTITEDSRLSIDLKLCGWELRSPSSCTVITETMPTWRMLWKQRRRWYLGAMQNVVDTGFNRVTAPYWRQQVMLAFAVGMMTLYLTLTAVAIAVNGLFVPTPFWLAVGAIFAAERVATVWDLNWKYRVFAVLVLPELLYALVLQSAYLGAVVQKITRSSGVWAHVTVKEA